LLARGHRVVAADTNLDPDHGLTAPERVSPLAGSLPRVEAETEALPFEPASFDLVVTVDSLHRSPQPVRALIELRRVTARGGLLLVWDSPVFRRRSEGEALITARLKAQAETYGVATARESEAGYLVWGELKDLFGSAGWRVEADHLPGPLRHWFLGLWRRGPSGERKAHFPLLVARRDG